MADAERRWNCPVLAERSPRLARTCQQHRIRRPLAARLRVSRLRPMIAVVPPITVAPNAETVAALSRSPTFIRARHAQRALGPLAWAYRLERSDRQ
jgi:hypothetical protein